MNTLPNVASTKSEAIEQLQNYKTITNLASNI